MLSGNPFTQLSRTPQYFLSHNQDVKVYSKARERRERKKRDEKEERRERKRERERERQQEREM